MNGPDLNATIRRGLGHGALRGAREQGRAQRRRGRSVQLSALVLLGGFLAASHAPSAASPSQPLVWWTPFPVDTAPPFDTTTEVTTVGCYSSSLCIGGDANGLLFSSTNPTGGASTWSEADLGSSAAIDSVACPAVNLCVAADASGDVLTSTNPTGGAAAWTRAKIDTSGVGVVCPSTTLCVVADGAGNVLTATNPTGGAAAWTEAKIDTTSVGLACPSTTLCVGYDGNGNIVTSTNPTGGAAAWSSTNIASAGTLSALTCGSPTLCLISEMNPMSGNESLYSSINPTGGAAAWISEGYVDTSMGSIACASATLCVALDGMFGGVMYSTDPTNSSSWSAMSNSGLDLGALSCPTTTFCIGSDSYLIGAGAVYTTTTPASSNTWTTTPIDGYSNAEAIACPTVSLCVAGTYKGDILASADPTGGTAAWSAAKGVDASNEIDGISCPSVSLCVAVDRGGNALTSTNPTGGAATWTKADIDGTNAVYSVSCPSTTFCVAVDNSGDVLTSTNPTGGAAAWTKTAIDGTTAVLAVSCPTTTLCVAGDGSGNVLTSTNPTGGAAAWSAAKIVGTNPSIYSVSCPSTTFCAATNDFNIYTATNPTGGVSAWTGTPISQSGALTTLTCATSTLCVAGDAGGDLVGSTDPTGGAGTWISTRAYSADGSTSLTAISCPSALLCVATGNGADVLVGAPAFYDQPAGGPEAVNSGVLNAAPALSAPTAGTTCSGGTNVSLSWSDSQSATAGAAANSYLVSGYNVLRSTSSSGPYSTADSVTGAPPATSATDCAPVPSAPAQALVVDSGTTNEDLYPITESASPSAGAAVSTGNQALTDPSDIVVTPDGLTAVVALTSSVAIFTYNGTTWSKATTLLLPSTHWPHLVLDPVEVSGHYWVYALASYLRIIGNGIYYADVYPITLNGASSTLGTTTTLFTSTCGTSTCPAGYKIEGAEVTPDGSKLYVATDTAVYDVQAGVASPTHTTITPSGTSPLPCAEVITPDSSHVYVADQTNQIVDDITTSTDTVTSTISLTAGAISAAGAVDTLLGMGTNGQQLYVAEPGTDQIQVLNTALAGSNPDTVAATVAGPSGDTPTSIAMQPDGTKVWITDYTNQNLLVLTTSNNTLSTAATLTGLSAAQSLQVTPDSSYLFVPEPAATPVVGVITTATNAVTNVGSVGAAPQIVAIAPGAPTPTTYYYEIQATHANDTSNASTDQSITVG